MALVRRKSIESKSMEHNFPRLAFVIVANTGRIPEKQAKTLRRS